MSIIFIANAKYMWKLYDWQARRIVVKLNDDDDDLSSTVNSF